MNPFLVTKNEENNETTSLRQGDAKDIQPVTPTSKDTSYNVSQRHHLISDNYQEIFMLPNMDPTTAVLLAAIN